MSSLELQLIGPLRIRRDGVSVELPGSRKVRALLAYLAVASNPSGRSDLCDLLWDVADDPRGELRWCLSKIRSLIEERRVTTEGDTIAVDLADCSVDAIEVAAAHQDGFRTLSPDQLRSLADRFVGDFLDGLAIERNPAFDTWLLSQRRRFRDIHTALLEHIGQRFSDEDARPYLDRWMRLAPFDLRPHELLLTALAAEGRIREGEDHLEATVKLFKSEDLDGKPLREIWRVARAQADEASKLASPNPAPMSRPVPSDSEPISTEARRASIAIVPFSDASAVAIPGGPADALVHDIITRLAKLRSIRVIAQGTMFTLRGRQHSSEELSQMLGVDYVVNGTFLRQGDRVSVRVELVETKTAGVIWADVFENKAADIFSLLDDIGLRIVVAIEREVEALESNRAILKHPGSLDAWEAHHRGLWHVYRFTQADNAQAQHFFQTAVGLDPTFSRAHSGLSFTHWQNAFQGWADRNTEAELAYRTASQSMMIDDRDPTAHWSLGRALWLRDRNEQSVYQLEQATELSPNFALAYYCLAFIQAQSGDPKAAVVAADRARELSPFDPLLFGMLGSRAMALVRLGEFDQAARWAEKAALRPNAHVHILAIAALALSLAGRIDEARAYVGSIRDRQASYDVNSFFSAFHILPTDKRLYQGSAKLIGLS
jgi:DNA-binding SARP family transcriptional activator/TolB-like protein/Flp pilus assembly protein TadD